MVCKCGAETGSKCRSCRLCAKEYMRSYRERKLGEGVKIHDLYNYTWRTKNPERYMLQTSKSRAKKKGWEFDLELHDIIIPDVCPVLNVKLSPIGGDCDKRPSLDRIDHHRGYVKDNIQVISWRANNLKSDGTLEEFIKLVEFMKNG